MDSWNAQLELTKARIAEIEDKIARQRQMAERLQNDDTSLPIPLISVMQESVARAKAHAQYIERRIAAHDDPRVVRNVASSATTTCHGRRGLFRNEVGNVIASNISALLHDYLHDKGLPAFLSRSDSRLRA